MRFLYNELPAGEIKLFHSSVAPGKRVYHEHHHTDCELSYVLTGGGVYSVLNREFSFYSSDLFLFGPDEIHCITDVLPNEKFELINIQFDSRLLWGGGDTAYLKLLKLFNERSTAFSNKVPLSDGDKASVRAFFNETEAEFNQQKPGYDMKVRLLLYSCLLNLYRNCDLVDHSTSETPHSAELLTLLSSAVSYINTHLSDELTLDKIAAEAHLSRSYFSTLFKKYNSITPFEYITIKRVEKAIEYLKTTNLSKLEIAYLCGFNSSANFYKAFSKVTGKKPGDYIF